MENIFDGIRNPDQGTWKPCLEIPEAGFGFAILTLVVFGIDLFHAFFGHTGGKEKEKEPQ
jgi:hypothetical protein